MSKNPFRTSSLSPPANSRALWMLGGLSLALYLVAFVLPFPLWRLGTQPPSRDWADLSAHSPAAGLALTLAWISLFGLYLGAIEVARRHPWPAVRLPVLAVALTNGIVLACGSYPGGAIDLYSYVAHTRIFLAGLNPFLVPPDAVPTVAGLAPFLGEWRSLSSPYGPLWELLAVIPGRLGDGQLLKELVAFKLWNLAALAMMMAPLSATLKHRAPHFQAAGCVLVAWNPLLLVEIAANGHNDSWMLLALAVAGWAWATRCWWLLLPSLTLGIAVKWVPAIVAPLFLTDQLRTSRGIRSLLIGAPVAALILVAGFIPFWTTPADLSRWEVVSESERVGFSWQAFVLLLVDRWRPGEGVPPAWMLAARLTGYALFSLVFLWSANRLLWRRWSVPKATFWLFVAYISLGAPAFRPWYTLWPLVPAALAGKISLGRRAVILTLGAALATVLYSFAWPWLGHNAALWLHLVGVPLSLAGAWLPEKIILFERQPANSSCEKSWSEV